MSSLSGAHSEADAPKAEPTPAPGSATPVNAVDLDLMRKAQTGDRAAYGQLVVRYQDRLYNAIVRMVGDREEARELTQETFVRGLTKLDSYRADAGPYTWLFRIGVNLAISQLRKVQRRRVFSLDAPPSVNGRVRGNGGGGSDDQAAALVDRVSRQQQQQRADGPSEQVEARERHEQVLAALGRLDSEYRAVLVMRDVEGFDYQQMADILGLPLGTLKSRLFRARLALRDELREYLKD